MKRLIAPVAAAFALASFALAAPAHADEAISSTVTLTLKMDTGYKASDTYGEPMFLAQTVKTDGKADDDNDPDCGTYALGRELAGQSSFKVLKSGSTPYDAIENVKFQGNALYELGFSGCTADGFDPSGNPATVTYAPAVSAPLITHTIYNLKGWSAIRTGGMKGKVTPDFKKKKVTIFVKNGKKWKKVASTKSKANGSWKVNFRRPKDGTYHYKVLAQGQKLIDSTYWLYRITWYHY